jgi:hypothetical protein
LNVTFSFGAAFFSSFFSSFFSVFFVLVVAGRVAFSFEDKKAGGGGGGRGGRVKIGTDGRIERGHPVKDRERL